MNPALAEVLARPDVWRGEFAVSPVTNGNPNGTPTLASGFPRLDAELPGGGWPRGQLTELLAEQAGIGELSLLLPVLARLTQAGGMVILLAPPHVVHAPAWAAAGVALPCLRLLTVADSRELLWAAVQVLRCQAVAASLMWLESVRPLPVNRLRRLHLAAGEGGGAAFLWRSPETAVMPSPAPLRLRLRPTPEALAITILKRRGTPVMHPIHVAPPRPVRSPRPQPGVIHALAGTGISPDVRPLRPAAVV